jgi:hypothetical protein
MPTGYVNHQYESIPGNETNSPTLSTKVYYPPVQSFGPKLGPNHMERDDELRNQDEPLPVLSESYAPAWESHLRAYPDALGWYLKLALGAPVTTAGNGVITDPDTIAIPAGAYRHVWTAPFGPSGASPLTMQFNAAYKDQTVFFKGKGAACDTLGIESPESGGCIINASGPCNYLQRISDPSLTPAYEALAVRPFVRGNLTLPTWLTGSGTHENFSLSISNPCESVRSLGIASKFPDALEKANVGPVTVTGSLPQRQLDADDYDALLNATGFAAMARWVSDSIIASSYPYKLYVQFSNAQYVAGEPDALANQRRHGASFDFKSTTPSTGSTIVTLVNATTNYL